MSSLDGGTGHVSYLPAGALITKDGGSSSGSSLEKPVISLDNMLLYDKKIPQVSRYTSHSQNEKL